MKAKKMKNVKTAKKLAALFMTAAMAAVLFTGCGAKGSADQLEKIKKEGKIVIAMEGQWAPWTYHDENDVLVGYDTEVGKLIAQKLGVEAEFVEGEWDGLFTGLDSGKYDVIINGVEITDERKQKYDFSAAYAYDNTVLIVPNDSTAGLTFDNLEGYTTTNSLGSTYADIAAAAGANVLNVDTLAETIDMILAGRADATVNAESSFYDYMNEHPEAPIMIADITDSPSEIAIPMRKGEESAQLREAIDKAIDELRASGELAALSEKYFGRDISAATN